MQHFQFIYIGWEEFENTIFLFKNSNGLDGIKQLEKDRILNVYFI